MDRSTGDMYSVKMVDRRQVREEFLFRNEISMLMAIQGQTTTALQLSQVLHDDHRMYSLNQLWKGKAHPSFGLQKIHTPF